MVYAMLSSGISWVRVEQYINPETRQLTKIDEIFLDYDPRHLLQTNPSDLHQKVLELKCGSVQTGKQMEALIHTNIPIGDPIGAIWGCVGYTVLLCFTLFKTGSLAKSIFGCH